MQPQSTAAEYWGKRSGYAANWYQFCAPYINERITGNPNLAPTPWAFSITGKPKNLLEIGCLDGAKLSKLLESGLIERGSGVDVAAAAIERGRLAHPHIPLDVLDLNAPVGLQTDAYDVIFSNGVLHHIENIETCVRALYGALQPSGWLIASEFTGPRRYAYTDEEIALIRQGQDLLPEEIRGAPFHPDQLASKLQNDPSEAISTDVIEPTLRMVFDEVTSKPFGGNVLMRALTRLFFTNYDSENPVHVEAVTRLHALDIARSQTRSHHTYFLCRRWAA